MLDKIRFWERKINLPNASQTGNNVSFKGFGSFEQHLACFKKQQSEDTPSSQTTPQTALPEYYYPNYNVKYGIPPRDNIKPISDEGKEETPPPVMVKYAVPPIDKKEETDDTEPPLLKYAIPNSDRW